MYIYIYIYTYIHVLITIVMIKVVLSYNRLYEDAAGGREPRQPQERSQEQVGLARRGAVEARAHAVQETSEAHVLDELHRLARRPRRDRHLVEPRDALLRRHLPLPVGHVEDLAPGQLRRGWHPKAAGARRRRRLPGQSHRPAARQQRGPGPHQSSHGHGAWPPGLGDGHAHGRRGPPSARMARRRPSPGTTAGRPARHGRPRRRPQDSLPGRPVGRRVRRPAGPPHRSWPSPRLDLPGLAADTREGPSNESSAHA